MGYYGSAIYTAEEARHKSLGYIAEETGKRCMENMRNGGNPQKWWAEFWRQFALLEAGNIKTNAEEAKRTS